METVDERLGELAATGCVRRSIEHVARNLPARRSAWLQIIDHVSVAVHRSRGNV